MPLKFNLFVSPQSLLMNIAANSNHQELVGFIWSIADKLRGPYRPPQYRRVMLPLIVLRRLDSVMNIKI
jgi:type I restriction enzyme M protein